MLVVHVTIRFDAAGIEAFKAGLPEVASKTLAEEGCVEYKFGLDMLEPNLIRIIETWESEAALEQHRLTDHLLAFTASLPEPLSFERIAYVAEPAT
jgi:quinol monooxygenase YgiN